MGFSRHGQMIIVYCLNLLVTLPNQKCHEGMGTALWNENIPRDYIICHFQAKLEVEIAKAEAAQLLKF